MRYLLEENPFYKYVMASVRRLNLENNQRNSFVAHNKQEQEHQKHIPIRIISSPSNYTITAKRR